MALELFDGKTGLRLIARTPADPEQRATILFDDDTWIQVHAPADVYWAGWPALCPVMDTLPIATAVVIQSLQSGMLEANQAAWQIAEASWQATLVAAATDPQLGELFVRRMSTTHKELYGYYEQDNRRIKRPPILTSIGPGRPLSARLPSSIYGNNSVFPLGTIEDIVIN